MVALWKLKFQFVMLSLLVAFLAVLYVGCGWLTLSGILGLLDVFFGDMEASIAQTMNLFIFTIAFLLIFLGFAKKLLSGSMNCWVVTKKRLQELKVT